MASFSNVWTSAQSSDVSEGFCVRRALMLAVAALLLAAGAVTALSELATHRGIHTVHTTPTANLARALQASHPAASLVGSPVLSERSAA